LWWQCGRVATPHATQCGLVKQLSWLHGTSSGGQGTGQQDVTGRSAHRGSVWNTVSDRASIGFKSSQVMNLPVCSLSAVGQPRRKSCWMHPTLSSVPEAAPSRVGIRGPGTKASGHEGTTVNNGARTTSSSYHNAIIRRFHIRCKPHLQLPAAFLNILPATTSIEAGSPRIIPWALYIDGANG